MRTLASRRFISKESTPARSLTRPTTADLRKSQRPPACDRNRRESGFVSCASRTPPAVAGSDAKGRRHGGTLPRLSGRRSLRARVCCRRRCSFYLKATAMVLGLHPIGSSRAPSLCLCTGRNASGQAALPWVVGSATRSLGGPKPALIRGRVFSAWSRTWSGARRLETSGSPPGSGSPSCPGP